MSERADGVARLAGGSPTATLSLGLLALMVSGPFLLPVHTDPIPSFWNEWWAGVFGLAAAVTALLSVRTASLRLPPALGIVAVILAALLLQFAFGLITFPRLGLLYGAYLLWAGLLLIVGRHLAETVGLARLADVLATAIVIGATLGAGIALLQWLGLAKGLPWIFSGVGERIFANLGQENHHAHFSWLGIASALYLRGRGKLSRPQLWLLILPLALGSVASGSRSVFLFPLILLAASFWARRVPGQGVSLLKDAAILVPVVIALSGLAAWVSPQLASYRGTLATPPAAAVTAGTRLYQQVDGPSARLAIARTAWAALLERPGLGHGAGNYAWASFQAAAGSADEQQYQVMEHAHNVVLQALVEFGAPTVAAALLLLLLWARCFFAQSADLEKFWCVSILGIGAIHALLEYPYWYAYFLGPTALLIGACDSGKGLVLKGRRTALYLLVLGMGGAVILANLRHDYAVIENASNRPLAAHGDRETAWRLSMAGLLTVQKDSLLSPWALLAVMVLAEPGRDQAADRAALCEQGIRFSPARFPVTRCAIQLAIAGRGEAAGDLARVALRAYPAERAQTLDELLSAGRAFPEVMALSRPSKEKP